MSGRRIYLVVGVAALVVYVGALENRFAMDDIPLVVRNPLVQHVPGIWQAFAAPYWPPDFGGHMYRPLAVATWSLDHQVDGVLWFHLVNLLWHAAASIAIAALARQFADDRSALVSGLLFAVHPVHVEAVANVVGRTELMAALFVVLGVYAALVHASVAWSAAAWTLALLSKENAAVLPALIVWAWILGVERPPRRQMLAFAASWLAVGLGYAAIRWHVLEPYARFQSLAPIFVGQSPLSIRLTAVAALADLARLLILPLRLRVDYSPDERTLVASPLHAEVLAGLGCFLIWTMLLLLTWRRGRRMEAFGLGWIGIAFLPVANFVFPTGVLLAERTLYLPSVGLVLAAGSWVARWPARWRLGSAAALVFLGATRTMLRVPVWRDDTTVTLSILDDSPRSYVGPKRMIAVYLNLHQPERALAAARQAAEIYGRDPTLYSTAAVAAYAVGQYATADSLLSRLDVLCVRCPGYYRQEAATARLHGYALAADSLEARARVLEAP